MEYCDLGDVYELLKSNINNGDVRIERNSFNGFSGVFLCEFIKQTATALKYIHSKNIIHRDLKLHNVLIKKESGSFKFKISDFGFACYDISVTNDTNDRIDTNDTNANFDLNDLLSKKYYKLCGTPYYMAPEIVFNMNSMENIAISESDKKLKMFYDKSIDIWSYGICIYELVFNILPFSNIKNMNDMYSFYKMSNIQVIMNKKITSKKMISNKFKDLLLHMICLKKEKRYNIYEIEYCIKDILKNGIFTSKVFASNEVLQDIVNCKENTYAKNEIMKCNIIRNPLVDPMINSVINSMKSICLQESWEKIERISIIDMEPLGKVEVGKMEAGKMEVGEMELGKVELGEMELGKVELGKMELGKVELGKMEAGKVELMKINNMWFFDWIFNK
jgi:serine/threonine protein kinase